MKNKRIVDIYDAETILIVGFNKDEKEKAVRFLNRYEKKEHGVDKDEYTPIDWLEFKKIRVYMKDDDEWFDWTEEKICKHCGKATVGKLVNGFVVRY